MSLDTEDLSTLTGIDRVNAIAREVMSLPYDQRASAIHTFQTGLHEREIATPATPNASRLTGTPGSSSPDAA